MPNIYKENNTRLTHLVESEDSLFLLLSTREHAHLHVDVYKVENGESTHCKRISNPHRVFGFARGTQTHRLVVGLVVVWAEESGQVVLSFVDSEEGELDDVPLDSSLPEFAFLTQYFSHQQSTDRICFEECTFVSFDTKVRPARDSNHASVEITQSNQPRDTLSVFVTEFFGYVYNSKGEIAVVWEEDYAAIMLQFVEKTIRLSKPFCLNDDAHVELGSEEEHLLYEFAHVYNAFYPHEENRRHDNLYPLQVIAHCIGNKAYIVETPERYIVQFQGYI